MNHIKRFELKTTKSDFEKRRIVTSEEAAAFIRQFYSDDIEIYESMFILLLNRARYTIGYAKISQGGIVGTVIDNKIIAKYCIDALCCYVVVAHNHPSGNTEPSDADRRITKSLKQVLGIIDVELADHVILTTESHYSFSDNGEL